MKRIFIFSALMIVMQLMAQVKVTSTSGGVYKITYGDEGDFSFYNTTAGQGSIWVHTWINPNQNSVGDYFSDSWKQSTVEMIWSASENAYVGTIDLNSKLFTDTGNYVPAGTSVSGINFMFKNTYNENATTYSNPYNATVSTTLSATLSTGDYKAYQGKTAVIGGNLFTTLRGDLTINLYDFSGRLLKNMNVKSTGSPIVLNLTKRGQYILRITAGNTHEVVKFAY